MDLNDKKIMASWHKNAQPWMTAIENNDIESRKLVTNEAIVSTVKAFAPCRVLDLGCGEGWLSRELIGLACNVTGVDAVDALIEKAKALGEGKYHTVTYESLTAQMFTEPFDMVVSNFSLLGKSSVERLFSEVPSLLNTHGLFVVQTLHPVAACGDLPYVDGWREGTWQGFSEDFVDPPPWYFRTIASWCKLFDDAGFVLKQVLEPVHPVSGVIMSLIVVAERKI